MHSRAPLAAVWVHRSRPTSRFSPFAWFSILSTMSWASSQPEFLVAYKSSKLHVSTIAKTKFLSTSNGEGAKPGTAQQPRPFQYDAGRNPTCQTFLEKSISANAYDILFMAFGVRLHSLGAGSPSLRRFSSMVALGRRNGRSSPLGSIMKAPDVASRVCC